jgi:oligopeptide/dipeptide ABC transporter ATP-binding protein
LAVEELRTYFYTHAGVVRALEGVNISIPKGETVGIVGETGCGKSVTALSILRLVPYPPGKIVSGHVWFKGKDLLSLREDQLQRIRGAEIAMVFQDPATYLNPAFKIGEQIAEAVLLHQDLGQAALQIKIADREAEIQRLLSGKTLQAVIARKLFPGSVKRLSAQIARSKHLLNDPPKPSRREAKNAAWHIAVQTLKQVQIPDAERVADSYPHELSGGMKQRCMIAMAMCCNPLLLIADEPTTGLDVTVQAQILQLLRELRQRLESSIAIITHDLGVVAEICDRVAIMYAGAVVEFAPVVEIFDRPLHPYTQGLLKSIPRIGSRKELTAIPGTVPDMLNVPRGCAFHPRCPYVMETCRIQTPSLVEVESEHFVSCYLHQTKTAERAN